MRLPTRVGLVQNVQDGGLQIAQHKLALGGLNGEEKLGRLEDEGPIGRRRWPQSNLIFPGRSGETHSLGR